MNGMLMFRPSEQASPDPVVPLAEISAQRRAQCGECAGSRLRGSVAKYAAPRSLPVAIASFHAVEHRLEFVATIHGVDYYNDSKATNVDATAKAIASFPGNIHLILGGKDKNSDYTQLNALLRERVKAVYTIGSAAEKIEGQIAGVTRVVRGGTLEAAVDQAAEPGGGGRCGAAGARLLQLRSV